MSGKTYKHRAYEFSDSEIDQIVDLTEWFAAGPTRPVDRRKYTRQVQNFAQSVGLLVWKCRHDETLEPFGAYVSPTFHPAIWNKNCEKCTRDRHFRLYAGTSGDMGDQWFRFFPAEALWRMFGPILEEGSGFYTITTNSRWLRFNVWHLDHPWVKRDETTRESAIEEQAGIISRLASFGYVYFQAMHGKNPIWSVSVLDRE